VVVLARLKTSDVLTALSISRAKAPQGWPQDCFESAPASAAK